MREINQKKFKSSLNKRINIKISNMDEQLRIILIIIVSVSIFGLLVFVYVKNYIRNKINQLVEEEKKKKSK